MPSLTHLAIPFSPSDTHVRAVEIAVREVRQLEMLVFGMRTDGLAGMDVDGMGRNGASWRAFMHLRSVDIVKSLRKCMLRTDAVGKRRKVVYWVGFDPVQYEADWTQPGREDIWSRAMREVQEAEAQDAEAEEKARVLLVEGGAKGKGKRSSTGGLYSSEAVVEVVDADDSDDACTP